MLGDLKNLVGAIAAAKIDTEGAVIVTHATNALALATLTPQQLPYPVYSSAAVPAGTVIMIQPEAVATGYEGNGQIYTSKQAPRISRTPIREGNRTLVFSLEGCCSTIELHPRSADQVSRRACRLNRHTQAKIAPAAALNIERIAAYTDVSINTTKGGDPGSLTKRCHLAGIAR